MILTFRRAGLKALAFIALALFAAAWRGTPAAAAPTSAWPQNGADLPTDPAVRFGVLPNGMRYAILKHPSPRGAVSLRLRIAAGVFQEPGGGEGVAHFLEHMSFRGSSRVPDGEVWKTLERLGLAFGADTNAFTSLSQTYYQFDLPTNSQASIDTGLMLMRETASELTLSQRAMDDERRVILSEQRLRDSPAERLSQAELKFWFNGQPAVQRTPIGSIEAINRAKLSQLRDFYNAYYRPERTILIAVGDLDPDTIAAKIRERFSDWTGVGPAGADPALPSPPPAGLQARLFVEAGAPATISMAWITPYDTSPHGAAFDREALLNYLAVRVLNRRLETERDSPSRPYLRAAAVRADPFPLGQITDLTVVVDPDRWRSGLQAAERVRRQALSGEVRQDEVDREVADTLTAFERTAAGAGTRLTSALATDMVKTVDEGGVISSPAQDLAEVRGAYRGVTADRVTQALRKLFQGGGPLILVSSAVPITGGEAGVAAAFAEADAAPLGPSPSASRRPVEAWPYGSFGVPGRVVDRRAAQGVNATFVRFANGVRLTVSPAGVRTGQVRVNVKVGRGRLDLPRDRASVAWAADAGGFEAGGLKGLDVQQIEQALSTKIYSVSFATGDDGFILAGVTRPEDIDTQLQVLAAYVTAPGWRAQGFEKGRSILGAVLTQIDSSPTGVLARSLPGLLHDGDPRWAIPSRQQIAAAKPDELRALLAGPLASGPIEVTVVGDIAADQTIAAVARTFGALPARNETSAVQTGAERTRFPAPTASPVIRYHSGRADQALALVAWPTDDAYAVAPKAAAVHLLRQVMQLRLIEQLRIADGATYVPLTNFEASKVYPGYGYLYAAAEVSPAQTSLVFDTISKVAADLAANRISDDELARARKPATADLLKALQTDGYWIGDLTGVQGDPRRYGLLRTEILDLAAVSADDVWRAARTYMAGARAWRLLVEPQPLQARQSSP
jgi:zinc protease